MPEEITYLDKSEVFVDLGMEQMVYKFDQI